MHNATQGSTHPGIMSDGDVALTRCPVLLSEAGNDSEGEVGLT